MKHDDYVIAGSGIANLYAATLVQERGSVLALRGHGLDPAGGALRRQAVAFS